jgi:hypothetical protein
MARAPTLWYTHINRQKIDQNRKHKTTEPVITIKRGKSGKAVYAHEVEFPAGSRLVYSGEETPILPCGARAVIISPLAPTVIR